MTVQYGAGESLYAEAKQHREEQKWSPVVYFDRPRCILCYRCVRMCGEGMDVWALGIQNRGVLAVIAPNGGDHLDCEQCGMCIDVCPVGALTSGTYRYKSRPWEMKHVSTVCTHCADGCKVTLGVRRASDGMEIVRADNRDKSGINGDFLCAKGRFGFDFVHGRDRLTKPLVRNAAGVLEPTTWDKAIRLVAQKFSEANGSVGVLGSPRLTNEEGYLLQKFARTILRTQHIDHERTADYPTFSRMLAEVPDRAAGHREIAAAPAILVLGGNPTEEHPLLAWSLRTNHRLNHARIYLANTRPIRLARQAAQSLRIADYDALARYLAGDDAALGSVAGAADFREAIAGEQSLVVIAGAEYRGASLAALLRWGLGRPGVKFALLSDFANARGVADMGVYPDLLPGYQTLTDSPALLAEYAAMPTESGLDFAAMVQAATSAQLKALYVVGTDPVSTLGLADGALRKTFVVVEDCFLTPTAAQADVVLPAASLYEKSGTVTNCYGDVQMVRKAADVAGVKPDFEILVRLAGAMGVDVRTLVPFGAATGVRADMGQTRGAQAGEADRHAVWLVANGLEPKLSPFDPLATLDEIERLVPGYSLDRINLFAGNDAPTQPAAGPNAGPNAGPGSGFVPLESLLRRSDGVTPTHASLFHSAGLSDQTQVLQELQAYQNRLNPAAAAD